MRRTAGNNEGGDLNVVMLRFVQKVAEERQPKETSTRKSRRVKKIYLFQMAKPPYASSHTMP